MEVPLMNGLTYADIYIKEIDLAIMIDGPVHFYSDDWHIKRPSITHEYVENSIDMLRINFAFFSEFVQYGPALISIPEENFAKMKGQLKEMIEKKIEEKKNIKK